MGLDNLSSKPHERLAEFLEEDLARVEAFRRRALALPQRDLASSLEGQWVRASRKLHEKQLISSAQAESGCGRC